MREDLGLGVLALEHRGGLLLQLLDRLAAGAGDRLVGGDDQALDPGGVDDRLQRDHQLHRRAVGVGDDPVVAVDGVVVDAGDDQRDVVVHAPVAGVVDDDRAGLDELRRPLGADLAAGGGEDDVEALDRLRGQRAALELRSVEVDLLARRALGGERDDLGGGEVALGEDLEERRADGAGGADDPDSVSLRRSKGEPAISSSPVGRCSPVGSSSRTASAPSSKALCSALTAVGTSSASITQEILIGEVEIISMLILCSPSV